MTTIENKEEQLTISKLGPFDVLLGRDKKCNINPGNQQFRVLINRHLPRYMECNSKFERSKAIQTISDEILDNPNESMRFFKRVKACNSQDCKNGDDDPVEQLDRRKSHEKIAHALRDAAAQQRKNREKHERSMAFQQQTIPQQNVVLQQPFNGPNEHEHRVTPQISNLTEQALIAQEQLMLAQYEDRPSFTSVHRVSLDNQSDFGGFDGYDNQYAAPVDLVASGLVQGAPGNSAPVDGEHPKRGLISESNSRHLERFEGTIDGSSQHYAQVDDFAEVVESEGYDNFDPSTLAPGSSLRHMEGSSLRQMEGVERTSSNRSFGKSGSHRSVGRNGSYKSFGRNASSSTFSAQNSLRHVDLGPSSRSFRSKDNPIDELSLLQKSMGTLSLGNSQMTGMSLGESTMSLQTRPELMSDISRLDIGESNLTLQTRPGMMTDGSRLDVGGSSFTLQTRPEMMSDVSRLDIGESTMSLQTRPEMISEKSRLEMSFEQPI